MIRETKNQHTKCEVLERVYARLMLKGGEYAKARGANQAQRAAFKNTLDALEDIRETLAKEAGEPAEPAKA